MVLITLIPAFAAMIYAIAVQKRRHRALNITLLFGGGFIAIFNAVFMYGFFMQMDIPYTMRCLQQFVSCLIVPIAYMYFAEQMGRKWMNNTTITLWTLVALLIIPTGIYPIDLISPELNNITIQPMMIYFCTQGKLAYTMHTADLIIMLQAFVTLGRLFVMGQTLRRFHLAVSPNVRYFICWWAAAIVFIIFTSIFNTDDFRNPTLLCTYYIGYSSLFAAIYLLISRNFNLRPVMLAVTRKRTHSLSDNEEDSDKEEEETDTDEGKVVENIDAFFLQSRMMAERIRMMMENEKRYLDDSLNTDTLIRELGTNRTYFYRMVKAEFNCTFAELIVRYRIKHAANILTTTNLPIQDIAMSCGFSNSTTFFRHFRQIYGMSPSQYRESKE